MTTALFVEAVGTAVTLARAVYGWLILLAVVVAILTLAAIACRAWAVNAAWGALSGDLTASDAPEAPREPESAAGASQAPPRRVPPWARTDHHTYEEAA